MKNTLKQQFSYSLLLLFIILCLIFVLFLNPLKKELEAKVFANINVSIQSFMKLSSGILINDFILKQYDSIKATCMDLQSLDGILYIAAFDEQNVLNYQKKHASFFYLNYFDKKILYILMNISLCTMEKEPLLLNMTLELSIKHGEN